MNKFKNFFLRVPLQEKILFTKNLALALKAGISLVNSLKLFRNQTKNRSFQKIVDDLIANTNTGVFLSVSLEPYKEVFGDLFVNIIRVAETSGTLPENLIYLGEELKKKSDLRKKVKGAMIYPMIILVATVGIAATMVVFVFPKILPLFASFKADLPFTTRMLIAVSDVLSAYGIWIFIGLLLFIIGLRFSLRFPGPKRVFHNMLFFAPLFGRAIVNFNMANMTRTLGLLLRSGVKIIEALTITGATLTNVVYRRKLETAAEHVRRGEFLSKYLSNEPRKFPGILVNMIEIGENTGNLTDNLFYLADYYENEVDDFVKNLSSILEPVLLLLMGGIVGFIALSFITPIYQLTRQIK